MGPAEPYHTGPLSRGSACKDAALGLGMGSEGGVVSKHRAQARALWAGWEHPRALGKCGGRDSGAQGVRAVRVCTSFHACSLVLRGCGGPPHPPHPHRPHRPHHPQHYEEWICEGSSWTSSVCINISFTLLDYIKYLYTESIFNNTASQREVSKLTRKLIKMWALNCRFLKI